MAVNLVVVTPEGEAFSESVEEVVLPGAEGDFGVLENHEKFLAPLKQGPMEIKRADGRSEWAAIAGGYAEVSGDRVVVLVDECVKVHEIDVDHVQSAHAEIERALAGIRDRAEEAEHRERLEHASVRATVHMDVHKRHHG